VDPLPAPAIALIAAAIARAWLAHDERARARPQPAPIFGDGWTRPRSARVAWWQEFWPAVGSLIVTVGIIVTGVVSAITR
jgi:hypothetical protein